MTPAETPNSRWSVVDGPAREEIFDSLRLFDEHRRVGFRVKKLGGEYIVIAQINGIAAESGSGHDWLLTIYFAHNESFATLYGAGPHKLYYNDKTRKGTFIDPKAA